MKTILGIILLLIPVVVSAVDLQPTPVQSAMEISIASMGNDFDEFETTNNPNSNITKEFGNKKSLIRAGLYSLMLPGLGQNYTGNSGRAKLFFAVEATTWVALIGFRTYGSWRKQDYIDFAATNASANLEGKSDDFIDWVGFYNDINEYNNAGRVGDRDRPYLADTPENHWLWQSSSDRSIFRHLKNSSRQSYRMAQFMVGFAVLNRVVSVLDAVRGARSHNNRIGVGFSESNQRKLKFSIDPFSSNRQVSLTLFTNL